MTQNSDASPRLRGVHARRVLLVALAAYLVSVSTGCMNPSTPFDIAINLGCSPVDPSLVARPGDPDRLVVLQHGLWRSRFALWKLERSLEAHGMRVLNTSYPSTRGTIEQHAERLRDRLEERISRDGAPPGELWFVGHSMGGLVIQAYLRRPDARKATGCVFLGTPHRGAVLAARRKDDLLFRLLLGTKAARQLDPDDPIHDRPIAGVGVAGTIIGGRGDSRGYSDEIPGDDDGRVGVSEAHLEGEADSVFLRVGHTAMTLSNEAILHVLHFVTRRRFDRP